MITSRLCLLQPLPWWIWVDAKTGSLGRDIRQV